MLGAFHPTVARRFAERLGEPASPQRAGWPRLAAGVGGLDWAHVEPLVQAQLGTLKIPVLVYTKFTAGVAAKEPLGNTAAT